jgi:nucleoside-diphosphate-sugar epimerase
LSIRRVLILGHTGFIGSALERRLKREGLGLDVVGLSPANIDLTRAEDAEKFSEHLDAGTAVIMCSAIKRQSGDTLENYLKNVAMAANVSRLLSKRPVAKFIFFSSTAVYGEDVTNLRITETTAVQPASYYGMAKHASECLLRKAVENKPACQLILLRPAQIYGPTEPEDYYGPTSFVRAALQGRQTTLWGDGTERREFIYIDDVTAMIERMLAGDFQGTLNLVSGRNYSFREAFDLAAALAPGAPPPLSRPRSKPKSDHGFCNDLLRGRFPEFAFTSLEQGIGSTCTAQRQTCGL